MSENIVQIRDFQRKNLHGYARRLTVQEKLNQRLSPVYVDAASHANWMGYLGHGINGVYLTGPCDLTMGRSDPEIITVDSGDCA